MNDSPADLPTEMRIPPGPGGTVYVLDASCHARPVPGSGEHELRDGPATDAGALPVYRSGRDGPPAVATGRVHVRLRRDASLEAWGGRLEALGFSIREVHPYAPFAGWVGAATGGAGFALRHWTRVLELEGVMHAEPQLLRPAARRD